MKRYYEEGSSQLSSDVHQDHIFAKELNSEVFLVNNFIANILLSYITTIYRIQVYQYLIYLMCLIRSMRVLESGRYFYISFYLSMVYHFPANFSCVIYVYALTNLSVMEIKW